MPRPMPLPKHRVFEDKVRELVRLSRSLEPDARRRILELLADTRKRVLAQIATLRPDQTYLQAALRQMKLEIEIAFEEFSGRAALVTRQLQQRAAQLGSAAVDLPLAAVRKPLPFPIGLSRTTLAVAQDYSADLISNLSKIEAGKVNAALQRAFLGGQSVTDVIQQVAEGLGSKGPLDLFSKVGERATTIAINEIKRVHSIAAQERMNLAAEQNADLKKQWRWVDVGQTPRAWHRNDAIVGGAHGQIRPVNEDFIVRGEALAFPRDPKGSAMNTINCHCVVVPYFAKEDLRDLQPTADQRRLLEEYGIEIVVSARENARDIGAAAA